MSTADIDHDMYFNAARSAVDKLVAIVGTGAEELEGLVRLKRALDSARTADDIGFDRLHDLVCGMYAELQEMFQDIEEDSGMTFSDLLARDPIIAKPLEIVVINKLAESGEEFSAIEWTGQYLRRPFAQN